MKKLSHYLLITLIMLSPINFASGEDGKQLLVKMQNATGTRDAAWVSDITFFLIVLDKYGQNEASAKFLGEAICRTSRLIRGLWFIHIFNLQQEKMARVECDSGRVR